MTRRSMLTLVLATIAMLILAAPAFAGGWATITLDALPRNVRAGQALALGFVVRQHGVTPTNTDLNRRALKPVVTGRAQSGDATIRVEARQEGATGHFVADITFPSAGVWEWQIEVPTYLVKHGGVGDDQAAVMEPLAILPAQPAATTANGTATQAEAAPLAARPVVLQWAGGALLALAAVIALLAQRGATARRRQAL